MDQSQNQIIYYKLNLKILPLTTLVITTPFLLYSIF